MRKFLHNDKKDIDSAIINTARRKNLPPALVEKDFYSEKLIPIVKRDLASEVEIEFDITLNEEELAIYIKYPSSFHNGYVKDSVKLEIGPLAAWTPWETKEISSFITQEYQQLFENKAFPVLITKPVRTFWEKAVILHQEAHREDGEVPLRYFRHEYHLPFINSFFHLNEFFIYSPINVGKV